MKLGRYAKYIREIVDTERRGILWEGREQWRSLWHKETHPGGNING
jgi:hypothetical protein